jgi:hypothetical protein
MLPVFLRTILVRLFLVLVAFSACRLLFWLWNADRYASASPSEIVYSFIYGMRFDLAAALLVNSALILLWLLPWPWWEKERWRKIEYVVFVVINSLAVGFNIIDVDFVNFTGKRMSFEIFKLQQDIRQHSVSILFTYWRLALIFVAISSLFVLFAPRIQPASGPRRSWLDHWLRLAVALAVIMGIRGGFQVKPLHPMHAYWSPKQELGLLSLNSTFNVLRTRHRSKLERPGYFTKDSEAIRILEPATRLTRAPLGLAKNFNVVVIVLESFASEYVGANNRGDGNTPFFDELTKPSFFYIRLAKF